MKSGDKMIYLRSTYGFDYQYRLEDQQRYTAEVISIREADSLQNKIGPLKTRRLKHRAFPLAHQALQYATRVRQRVNHYRALRYSEHSICLCGHAWSEHNGEPDGLGCTCGECARFCWIWSEEADERVKAGLGVITLAELLG